ncbi:lycopene cyclase family protein [Mongoliibacter ruber]|uniref:Lycopene beta-cyclase n=1 Tax=Mongoliibacter ruber TaxID=1750599 RepID=A0A2T0WW84_9BACT|nr:lycopene cyclase family protein [Mongoliibacter ruber]PRY90956.1 lycopene beta-cyclase [Mongoliibacter ruber]
MKAYDYIVCGFGCAGISLIRHIIKGPLLDKKILVVDIDSKSKNDRTWCYWSQEPAAFHPKTSPLQYWDKIKIIKDENTILKQLEDLKYFHIKSSDFYKEAFEIIQKHPNITFIQDEVEEITSVNDTSAIVKLKEHGDISCQKAFTSIPNSKKPGEDIIKQIFVGWELNFDSEVFDPSSATFMHFDTISNQATDFFYILPFSKNSALIEFTTYTKGGMEEEEMENHILKYLQKYYPNETYEIKEKEKGCIPMSTLPLAPEDNYDSVVYLGTLGGCTKASTGFTFYNIQKHCAEIVQNLEMKIPVRSSFGKEKQRFNFYDNILLNIVSKWPNELPGIFYTMFSNNKAPIILKFLNEETSFLEEISILMRLKFNIFIKSLLKYERH